MIIKNHKIVLKDTSPGEMARFRQFFLDIWRQQIEDDNNAAEMEKFIRNHYGETKTIDQEYTTTWLGEVVLKSDIRELKNKNNPKENIFESFTESNVGNIENQSVNLLLNGHFYTKEGKYLGKIKFGDNVYITDEVTFLEIKNGKTVSSDKIIFFTEKSELNNEQFLNRANWVFGEGGGAFADRYAMTIKNLRLSGSSGYGPKAFESDEAMYIRTMSHGIPAKTLYPDYLNGTYKGANAQAFALAKRNLTDLNKNEKMNIAIKGVINSFIGNSKNEGYNNWRGSGDTLYTEEEKKEIDKNSGKITKSELKNKDKKVYAYVKTQKDNYWETVGKKYRRHSFLKIWYEKK